MVETSERPGTRLMDRTEYASKPKPITARPDETVAHGVGLMVAKNYGCVIIVDGDDKVIGVVTERDVMNKLVQQRLDAATTPLSAIMTPDPRTARETDNMLDWLRIMSNERFRRLPVVDDQGRIKALFTQGDFVSYTWPDLLGQIGSMARATVTSNLPYVLIGGGIAVYSLVMVAILSFR